jgi:DNA (cytosine-5)-methyltransferase 1
MHKGPRGTEAVESGHVVTVGTLRAHHPGTAGVQSDTDHIVAIQDVRGLDKKQNGKGWSEEGVSYTVDTHATQGVAVAFAQNTRDEVRLVGGDGQIVGALAAQPGMKQTSYIAYDTTQVIGFNAYNNDVTGDVSKTIDTGADYHHVPIAFSSNMSVPDCQTDGTTPTLKLGGHGGGNPPAVAIDAAHAFKVRGGCEGGGKGYLGSDEVAFTISTHQDQHIFSEPAAVAFEPAIYQDSEFGVQAYDQAGTLRAGRIPAHQMTLQQSTVRRLTPVECERLQGFPDNFTAIPWRKKDADQCPDGPRYKALGNSMAVPVMRWIGERINRIDDLLSLI